MKRLLVLPIVATFLLAGCNSSKTIANGTTTDLNGLPKFKFIDTISGNLVQLCSDDTVVLADQGRWLSSQSTYAIFDVANQLHWPKNQSHPNQAATIWRNRKLDSLWPQHFLTEDGKERKYLAEDSIEQNINGKKLLLKPVNIPSTKYRYYRGQFGIYASSLTDGIIAAIYEGPMGYEIASRDDVLYISKQEAGKPDQIIQFGVGRKPTSIYQRSGVSIRNISRNGDLFLKVGQDFLRFNPTTGKKQIIPNGSWEVTDLAIKGKSWLIGFRTDYSSDRKNKNSYMVVWNDKGETVNLVKLCPELKDKITSVKGMLVGKVMTNANGTVAFELSGYNPNPDYNVGGPNPGDMLDRNYVNRVYVIKAIE
jgi:hypothetical protein